MEPVTLTILIIAVIAVFFSFMSWFSIEDKNTPFDFILANMRGQKSGKELLQALANDTAKSLKKHGWPQKRHEREYEPIRTVVNPLFAPPPVVEVFHTFQDGSQLVRSSVEPVGSSVPSASEKPAEYKRTWFLKSKKIEVITMTAIVVGAVVIASILLQELMYSPIPRNPMDNGVIPIGMNPIYFLGGAIGLIIAVMLGGPTLIELIEVAADWLRRKPKGSNLERDRATVILRLSQGKSFEAIGKELGCTRQNITAKVRYLVKHGQIKRNDSGAITITERGKKLVNKQLEVEL